MKTRNQMESELIMLVELHLSVKIPAGADGVQEILDPPNMVGPPATGKSFAVQYVSIHADLPMGQRIQCMIDGGFGGHWLALFHQGTFAKSDVFVCSQLCSFVLAPKGKFHVNR